MGFTACETVLKALVITMRGKKGGGGRHESILMAEQLFSLDFDGFIKYFYTGIKMKCATIALCP